MCGQGKAPPNPTGSGWGEVPGDRLPVTCTGERGLYMPGAPPGPSRRAGPGQVPLEQRRTQGQILPLQPPHFPGATHSPIGTLRP